MRSASNDQRRRGDPRPPVARASGRIGDALRARLVIANRERVEELAPSDGGGDAAVRVAVVRAADVERLAVLVVQGHVVERTARSSLSRLPPAAVVKTWASSPV
jgi:hypothetical protein